MLETIKDIAQPVALISTAIGVILAVVRYYYTTHLEKEAREYGTYNALDEKYLDFQKLCMERPYLDVFDVPDKNPVVLDEQQTKQQLIAYTMLISILERAYLMYFGHSEAIKKRQWSGWEGYMRQYASRPSFRESWKTLGDQFDTDFLKFMNGLIVSDRG